MNPQNNNYSNNSNNKKYTLTKEEKIGRNVMYVGIGLSVVIAILAIIFTTQITSEGILNQMDLRYVTGFFIFGTIIPVCALIRERIIKQFNPKKWTLRLILVIAVTMGGGVILWFVRNAYVEIVTVLVGLFVLSICVKPSNANDKKEENK